MASAIPAKIFMELLKLGSTKIMKDRLETYSSLSDLDKEALLARFQAVLGNPFDEQLIAIRKVITEATKANQVHLRMEVIKADILALLNGIKRNLQTVENKLTAYVNDPIAVDDFTWNEFEATSTQNFIDSDISWLTERLTTASGSRGKLVDDLAFVCEPEPIEFAAWQQEISLTFSRALLLRTAYIACTIARAEARNDAGSTRFADEEIAKMEANTRVVMEAMEEKYRQVKCSFLTRRCTDHGRHCGARAYETENCSQLTSTVYRALRNSERETNQELATNLATTLRDTYQQFMWSVVVVHDYHLVDVQANAKHIPDVWMQVFGSKSRALVARDPARNNYVMSRSHGPYGVLLCYRIRTDSRAAVVFWADKAVLKNPDLSRERQRLATKWSDPSHNLRGQAEVAGAGSIYEVFRTMQSLGMDHVFGVGVREKLFGFDLDEDQHGQFPVFLNGRDSAAFVWPEPQPTLEYELRKDAAGLPSTREQIAEKNSKIFRDHSESTGFPVAVKEIRLAGGGLEVQNTQVQLLDNRVAALKQLNHPNVVKYLGSQYVTASIMGPRYEIVMEFCDGETLSQRVTRQVTLREVADWSLNLLNGLAYLHGLNIAHRSIQGDHIMLSTTGGLKIFSVIRIRDVIALGNGSYRSQTNSFLPFQAPDCDGPREYVGRKSDIWSFGCVVIQMISGKPPVTMLPQLPLNGPSGGNVGRKISLPHIPINTPARLKMIIESCLKVEPSERPAASILIPMLEMFGRELDDDRMETSPA